MNIADGHKTEAIYARHMEKTIGIWESIPEKNRNVLCATIIRADGTIEELEPTYNSRVLAGASWQAQIMGNASGAASMQYIALSSNASFSPVNTDTAVSTEITTVGLGRAIGTYGTMTGGATLNAAAAYTISKTFTASGTMTVYGAGLLNASSAGTLYVESTMTAASLANLDSLAITWTINI